MGKSIVVTFDKDRKPIWSDKHRKSDKFGLDALYAKERQTRPEVFDLIVKYCWQAKNAGFKRYSMQTIIEVIRWYQDVKDRSGSGWKMDNSLVSRYAREVMTIPGLGGFFHTRGLKS